MFRLTEIIDLAVQIERNGEKHYADGARVVGRPDIVRALEKLASDEREHVAWFERLRKTAAGQDIDPSARDFGRELLGGILGAQAFSLAEADFTRVENVKDVLRVALEFEKDTILFYEMILSAVADAETRKGLDNIIKEENQHVKLIEGFLSEPLKPLDSH